MEVWKDIKGYEGLYQVSNLGRIKSLPRGLRGKEKILIISKDKTGYCYVGLSKNNIKNKYKIHRLLAIAFIPNPENKPQVNHINSIRNDNRLENLEWVTASENAIHGYKSGFRKPVNIKGEQSWCSKLKETDIVSILNDTRTHKAIAKDYNVATQTITAIKQRKAWKHVSI